MGKPAATKKTTNTEIDAQNYLAALEIKQRFIGDAFSLGWRLVVTFIVPVMIGVLLDRHFKTKPSYTLVGMFLAVAASIVIIKQTVKEVNQDTAAMTRKTTKKREKHA